MARLAADLGRDDGLARFGSAGGSPKVGQLVSSEIRRGRHAADGEAAEGDSGWDLRVRGWIGIGLLWAGRILLVLAPSVVLACRWGKPLWVNAPMDAAIPDHWLPTLTLVVLIVFGLTLPLLILPVTSPALIVSQTEDLLRVRTVLGTRQVRLPPARARSIYVPGRVTGLQVVVIRDGHLRWVVIANSEGWQDGDLRFGGTFGRSVSFGTRVLRLLGGVGLIAVDVALMFVIVRFGLVAAGL